jgi:serine/threonine protein kinase
MNLSTSAPRALPTTVGRYRLLRQLSRGGRAVVCAAVDATHNRRVAIKLFPRPSAHETHSKPILREAQFALEARGPHIVAAYEAGRYAGGGYLAMELVEGPSLQTIVERGPLPWRLATSFVADACVGVRVVHSHRGIHCDVTPSNLLCTAAGAVKLADFGLARRLETAQRPPFEIEPAGTLHFMSPEQCRGEELDERTDIYSLGATYHALLTGRAPFAGATPMQIMFAQCSTPPPDPRRVVGDIPTPCAAIVHRAMAKRRADRYDSAGEMRDALRALLAAELDAGHDANKRRRHACSPRREHSGRTAWRI